MEPFLENVRVSCSYPNAVWILEMVRKTCVEMLEDRGYRCSSRQDLLQSIEKRRAVVSGSKGAEAIQVHFEMDDRLGVKRHRAASHCIFVTTSGSTNATRRNASLDVETFMYSELVVNKSRHKLVPKHTLLSKEDQAELEGKYKLSCLPSISKDDPICRYYNFQVGRIVRIDRKGMHINGSVPHFRLVVA